MRSAILTECRFAAPHTKNFRLEVEGPEGFRFEPGQYVLLSADGAAESKARAYSIASAPRPDNSFELCLNRVERPGSFSNYLFGLEPGARLWIEGPYGKFGLRPQPRDSLFLATGTGIAPIRAMVHCLVERGAPVQIALLFGIRDEGSILYRAEFERLVREHPSFRFAPTLSRPGEHWDGAIGYVQGHVLRLLDGRRDVDVYICGLRAMVDEVRALLVASGHDPAAIFHERY